MRLRHATATARQPACWASGGSLYLSVGANSAHATRSNADKRRAVKMLLADEEWAGWSNRQIATACAVNPSLVDKMRKEIAPSLPTNGSDSARTYTTKHGTTATMNTANIGKHDTGLVMKNGRRLVLGVEAFQPAGSA